MRDDTKHYIGEKGLTEETDNFFLFSIVTSRNKCLFLSYLSLLIIPTNHRHSFQQKKTKHMAEHKKLNIKLDVIRKTIAYQSILVIEVDM